MITLSKKKNSIFDDIEEKIIEESISGVATELMKIHGVNMNLARALPDFRDGLKIVTRRIQYDMYHDMKLTGSSHRAKVAAIMGDVMNRYHPHGDSSIANALVGMAQEWNMSVPLVDGQGNFGSQFGDSAAAARYIEARLTKFAEDCFFSDLEDGVVDMITSYNNYKIPEVLPAKYPVLLINGSFGMGYGMAASIPPHNLKEVLVATIALIKNPKTKITLYPDSPTGCDVLDKSKFDKICKEGNGSFRMRGHAEIDEKNRIIISSIPYQTNNAAIINKLVELVKDNKIAGIHDIVDESKKDTIRIVVYVKTGFNPVLVRTDLYKKTPLMTSYSVGYNTVAFNRTINHNVRGLLLDWIDFRREIKYRATTQRLSRVQRRIHILDAVIKIILESDDKLIADIRNSKNRSEIVEKFIKIFKISDIQAEAIADFKFYQLSKENVERFKAERDALLIEEKGYEDIIIHPETIDEIIVNELTEGIKKYGTPRRSLVIEGDDDDDIPDTEHRIAYTKGNMIKKLDHEVTNIGTIKQGDTPIDIMKVNNRDKLLVFDDIGKVYRLDVNTIPQTQLSKPGADLSSYIPIVGNVVSIIKMPSEEKIEFMDRVLFLTAKGMIKSSVSSDFLNVSNSGMIATKMDEGDYLTCVKLASSTLDVLIYSSNGFGISYPVNSIPNQLRNAKGVKAMVTKKNIITENMELFIRNGNDNALVTVTEKGWIKKTDISAIPVSERGKAPVQLVNVEEGDTLKGCQFISDKSNDSLLIICKNKRETLPSVEIPMMTRIAKGKKLIAVPMGEQIVDVRRIIHNK